MSFTTEEYADMVFMYGLADGNAAAAARDYGIRFPGRNISKVKK